MGNHLFNKFNPQRFFRALDMRGILALAGVAGPLVLVLADVIAAVSQPDYDFVRDSISSLALTSMGWIQTIGFMAIGLLIEIFAAGLYLNMRRKAGFGISITLLAFFGFGLLLIGAFRADPVGGAITVEGDIHVAASKSVLWLFFFAVVLLLPSLKGDPFWQAMFNYTYITSLFSLGLVFGYPLLPEKLSWFGLYERVLIGNALVWVEVLAIRLLMLSIRRKREAGPLR